jgi:hypothetical protein
MSESARVLRAQHQDYCAVRSSWECAGARAATRRQSRKRAHDFIFDTVLRFSRSDKRVSLRHTVSLNLGLTREELGWRSRIMHAQSYGRSVWQAYLWRSCRGVMLVRVVRSDCCRRVSVEAGAWQLDCGATWFAFTLRTALSAGRSSALDCPRRDAQQRGDL